MPERINLGKVLVTLEDEHDSTRSYDKYCEVTSGGSSFVSKKDVPIGTPITDTTYWQKRASKGADGTNGVDGNDGLDAYQPFKGWYDTSSSLGTAFPTPQVGDYAYVVGASASDPVTIYKCSTAGTWSASSSTFNPANNQEFASGESLNNTHIVDNLNSSSPTDVLSAKQGKELKGQIDALGPKISKITGETIEYNVNSDLPSIYQGKQLKASDANIGVTLEACTKYNASNFLNKRVDLTGADRIEFYLYASSSYYGCLFVNANDVIVAVKSRTSSQSGEISMSIPAGARYFIWSYSIANSDNYCRVRIPQDFTLAANCVTNENTGKTIDKDIEDIMNHDVISDQLLTREFLSIPQKYFYGMYKIDSSGAFSSAGDLATYRIPVRTGDFFVLQGYGVTTAAALSFSTSATPSSVTMIMMHNATTGLYYSYKVTQDGYIYVCTSSVNDAKYLLRRGQSELEKVGISTFSYGTNVLQPYVGTDVTDTDIWGSGYLAADGSVSSASGYHYTKEYIPVLAGSYLSRIPFFSSSRLVYYDSEKNVLGAISTGNNTSSIIRNFPDGTAYVRVSVQNADTSTLALTYQGAGQGVFNAPAITAIDNRIKEIENKPDAFVSNDLSTDFAAIKDKKWLAKTVYGGSYVALTSEVYGTPSISYQIPIDTKARVIHIKFDFRFTTGKLAYYAAATNQPLLSVRGASNYKAVIRQNTSLYNNSTLTRRQHFLVLAGDNNTMATMDNGNLNTLWGEPAYILRYKGVDYSTASGYTVNITSTGILVKDGDTTLETIAVTTDESLESVCNKINTNSAYLTAEKVEMADVKYSDCLTISDVPLCTSTGVRPLIVRNLLDTKWHTIEAVLDYDAGMSWTNLDGYTLACAIGNGTTGYITLGGEVNSTIGLAPYTFRDIHIEYCYGDAEVITYPNNVSGNITRLISNSSPYLMIFEGHGIVNGTDAEGVDNNMDVTTDRLRVVFEAMRAKGFVPVTWHDIKAWYTLGTPLPKRCYTLMMDDFRIENYMNLSLRKPFVQFGVTTGLAIITGSNGVTRSRSEEVTIDGVTWTLGECFDAIVKAGWYPCSHTLNHTVLSSLSAPEFEQCLKDSNQSCIKLGIYDDILVYPTGSLNIYQQEILYLSGFVLGVNVAINGYNCRLGSRYKIYRNEIGIRESLTNILAKIV